jgi:hypothetical protein
MVSDTCNYVDVPILCTRLKAAAALGAGVLVGSDSSSGFIVATDSAVCCGIMSMEATSAADQYFTAMLIGTAYMKAADSIKSGAGVVFSDSGVVAKTAADRRVIGTMLDGSDTPTGTTTIPGATRAHRVFIWGEPYLTDTVWV